MRVAADLKFSIDLPNRAGRSNRCVGRVAADGTEISVTFDPMPSLTAASTRPLARPLAHHLAHHLAQWGLTVQLVGPDGSLARLGAGVRTPWWQWIATRGAPIELVSVRALFRSLAGPRVFEVALPSTTTPSRVIGALRSVLGRARGLARQVRRQTASRRR